VAKVQISLPDQLANEARRARLLSSARLEGWLREQLNARHVDELFSAMDRMATAPEPAVMSPEAVAREHDSWLRAEVQRALDNSRRGIPHDAVMQETRAIVDRLALKRARA